MSYEVVASESGVFGMVLAHGISSEGNGVLPGAILIKGKNSVTAINPDARSELYFSALVLWSYYCGPGVEQYANDKRLPGFVRVTLAELHAMRNGKELPRRPWYQRFI